MDLGEKVAGNRVDEQTTFEMIKFQLDAEAWWNKNKETKSRFRLEIAQVLFYRRQVRIAIYQNSSI